MEDGTIVLVGATTENPSFELNAALAVARARAGVQVARRRRRSRSCSRAPRQIEGKPLPLDAEARAALERMADGDGRASLTLAEEIWRAARKGEIFDSAKLQEIVQRRAPIYDKAQDGHYNLISRAAQIGARLRSGRRALLSLPHARCRRAAALYRAPRRAHGDRGYRAGRSAGAGDRQCRQGRLRFSGQPGRRTRDRAGA